MTTRPPLLRERSALLGGVSVALADHLGWSVRTVRAVFVVSSVLGGAGALLYLWLWALVPVVPDDSAPAVRRRAPIAAILVGVGAATAIVLSTALAGADTLATNALIVVVLSLGGAVAWNLTLDRTDPDRSREYALWVRGLAAVILLLTGIVTLLSRPAAINAVLGVGVVVLGIAVVVAPRVVTLWTELQASQTARVREEQRAEMAAHLHDSVLQTLALIQNRAGASSEVARIARAQERELRDWLFTGSAPVDADLASELREIAALIELDYAVRIDVVAVGEFGPSPVALVAAAREAMLNAARHAGGEVSVYLESTVSAIDIFIRDRGPGVTLETVPDDRLGIRESIIGRMARAGGSATIGAGADGSGTEIHLHLEVPHD